MGTRQERHWRRLGRLLVDEGLIDAANLEYALDVQRESGGLLGEILVTCGFVTSSQISEALGRQYGVRVGDATELRERRLRVPDAPGAEGSSERLPLGRLLVQRGLLSESGLERALVDQRQTGRLLGEIVVSRGWVSAEDLQRAIAEQEGPVNEGSPEERAQGEPEVFEVVVDGSLLHAAHTFLDAADLAFELIERENPERIEIVRVSGAEREAVWTYSRPDTGPGAGAWGAGWPLAPRSRHAA